MNTNQNYSWKQIPVKDTQLKVGDRVKVISGNYYSSNSDKIPIESNSECYIHFLDNSDKSILLGFKNGEQHWAHNDDTFKCVEILPTPKWLPIDRNNLPVERVAVRNNENQTHYGKLWVYGTRVRIDNDNILNPTHYIALQDLLNLPISE